MTIIRTPVRLTKRSQVQQLLAKGKRAAGTGARGALRQEADVLRTRIERQLSGSTPRQP